jgi:hypothetical protein
LLEFQNNWGINVIILMKFNIQEKTFIIELHYASLTVIYEPSAKKHFWHMRNERRRSEYQCAEYAFAHRSLYNIFLKRTLCLFRNFQHPNWRKGVFQSRFCYYLVKLFSESSKGECFLDDCAKSTFMVNCCGREMSF